jgi:hypothetical protein
VKREKGHNCMPLKRQKYSTLKGTACTSDHKSLVLWDKLEIMLPPPHQKNRYLHPTMYISLQHSTCTMLLLQNSKAAVLPTFLICIYIIAVYNFKINEK